MIASTLLLLTGCLTAQQHAVAVSDAQSNKLTVGKVEAHIRKGMSGAQVAEVLGSPNIVSTDEDGHEVWVYDKISTLDVVSSSSGGLTLGAGGLGGSVGGMGLGSFSSGAGARSTSQKTLTVIIKFDGHKKVRDYAYNYSSF
jgi:outer membrane protein assembly factor BamE (lipoprotein component of BamABCDE complex)